MKRGIPRSEETPAASQANDEASRTHDRESDFQACLTKVRKHLFVTTIRLSVLSPLTQGLDRNTLAALAAVFGQFSLPGLNGFRAVAKPTPCVLSTEEIATLWHLPISPAASHEVDVSASIILPPPRDLPTVATDPQLAVLGETLYREQRVRTGLRPEERRRHLWVVGKTGTGKSTLLENLLLADIQRGRGVGLLDPHGDLAENILRKIPANRTNDVILIDPADEDFPIGFNPLDCPRSSAGVATDDVIASFYKLFGAGEHGSWGPRLEDILRHAVLSLIHAGNASLPDILRLLDADPTFRETVVRRLRDPLLVHWWKNDFPSLQANRREDPFASVKNKLRQLLAVPAIRNILAQRKSRLDFRAAMDKGAIVLCNLSKGKLGERTSAFLGSLLVTQFQLAAMNRANLPERDRRDFFLSVDEFQNFATPSFAEILSEARKYRLCLTLANQYVAQMPDALVHGILGNVGTLVSFQVGATDAEMLATQMGEPLSPDDLVQLPRFQCYVRTEYAGQSSRPFSLATLPPTSTAPNPRQVEKIRRVSRQRYATPRRVVERVIGGDFT